MKKKIDYIKIKNFKKKINFVYLGRIHPVKGIDIQIESLGKIVNEGFNAHLHIIGPDDGSLIKLKEKVHELKLENNVSFYNSIFSNFILEGLEKILDKIEDSTKLKIHPNHIKRMLLVKTEYLNDFDIEFDQYIIYLPQTNQIFYTSNKNLDRGIFLSHAYVLFIEVPLAGIEPATHGLEVHRSVH